MRKPLASRMRRIARRKVRHMKDEQITGRVKQAAGRAQDAAGALTGNLRTQARGKARAAGGSAEALYGDVLDTMESMILDRPWTAIAASAFVGFLIGAGAARR